MASNNATKQATKKAGRGGVVPPKERQFGQPNGNPRSNGAWRKEDTARFHLEQIMKMSMKELLDFAKSEKVPLFDRKLAQCIIDGKWHDFEGMMNQVYGMPKQEIKTSYEAPIPLVDLTDRKKNGEDGTDDGTKQD